jgi:hypothetical protein
MLPVAWREESVRVRRRIAQSEDQRPPKADREDRLFDDAYASIHLVGPKISDVVYRISRLRYLTGMEAAAAIPKIEDDLRQFDHDLIKFSQSAEVQELLQPASPHVPIHNFHAGCCPPSPFQPHRFKYPPIGYLQMSWQSYQVFTRFHLYSALRPHADEINAPGGEEAGHYAIEVCRTFAGIEESLGGIPGIDIPCGSALLLAAMCLPADQTRRFWIRYKLGHLESSGMIALRKVKEKFAASWNMPDIVTDGFYPSASPPHLLKMREDDLLKEMEGVELKGKGGGSRPGSSQDNSLQGLKTMRGVFDLVR